MTLESFRPAYQTTLRIVLGGFLLSFAPPATVAQTTSGTTTLDGWRISFDQQIDDEIERLASASRVEAIPATDSVPSESSSPSYQPAFFSESTYRRTGIGRSLPRVSSNPEDCL